MTYFRRIIKKLCRQEGFSLIDMVLGMALISIMMGVSAEVLISQTKVAQKVKNQAQATPELGYALSKLSYDILHLSDGKLIDISSNSIEYYDMDGNHIQFALDSVDGELALMRNTDPVITDVDDFSLDYFDEAGNSLTADVSSIADVRRVKFTITKNQTKNGGGSKYSTLIIPRSFIGYTNYQ